MPAAKAENDEPKPKDTVEGFTGKPTKTYERPKDASENAVVSDVGATEPTAVFGGDGVTPFAEWDKSQEERRKKQAEFDEKRRERAKEDAGVMLTTEKTEKHKHG